MKVWLLNLQLSRIVSVSNTGEPNDPQHDDILYNAEYTNGEDSVTLTHRAGVITCAESEDETEIVSSGSKYALIHAAVDAFHSFMACIHGHVTFVYGKEHNND
jgi:hypothetical protein